MKSKLIIGAGLLLMAFSTAFAEGPTWVTDKPKGDIHPAITEKPAHKTIQGTVEKIEGDMVHLKLDTGVTRRFGVAEAKKEGLKSLKPGDKVTLEVDEANLIADIHNGGSPAEGSEQGHRSVKGTVERFDPFQKRVTVKLDDGKTETFELKMPAMQKMNGIDQGTKVTMEIDEQNLVMDVHKG